LFNWPAFPGLPKLVYIYKSKASMEALEFVEHIFYHFYTSCQWSWRQYNVGKVVQRKLL